MAIATVVAPFVGAWIEIPFPGLHPLSCSRSLPSWERGLKYQLGVTMMRGAVSLPSWERGLKLLRRELISCRIRRSLRGSVD